MHRGVETERRMLFASDRVAAESLRGQIERDRFVAPEARSVAAPSTFLLAEPGGARDRELLHGDRFETIEARGGWSFGRATKDGYVGWVATADLGAVATPTHVVSMRHTHVYPAPDIKQPPLMRLPFGAAVAVGEVSPPWARASGGWVRADHLRGVDRPMHDPVAVAALFLGSPYLWAGNTGDGIDCSGLIQVACLACGIACPGDSDLQETALGAPLPEDAHLQRGDAIFWKGHVAWVADADLILHANARAMAVTYEPLEPAIARIAAQGDGMPTARRRL